MSTRLLLFSLMMTSLLALPAHAQERAEATPAPEKKERHVTHLDSTTQALANQIDDIRAKMAAENERHFQAITQLRNDLKIASDNMIAHRKGGKASEPATAKSQ